MERMLTATAAAENRHYWFRGLRRTAELMLTESAAHRSIRTIVDCGAGTGRNLDWLSRYGFALGVELTPLGLAVGRAHGRRMVRGSVAALPVPDASFDLATSFDVLYCLDDATERKALDEMWRVLRPGGLVLVNVAALDVLRGSHSALTSEVRRYTRQRLAARLEHAGFRVDRLTFTNCSLLPPALLVRTIQRLTGRASEPSEADLRIPPAPVNAALDACLRMEARLLAHTDLPIGTSLMARAVKIVDRA
jgi:SAM-dependent methyltransferase